jgi:hypothetical protein
MTTARQYSESEGSFNGYEKSPRSCPYCGSPNHYYRIWESSDGAYEDEKHECLDCHQIWWVDGIDS